MSATNILPVEAFLLSQMRSRHLVTAALSRRQLSEVELGNLSDRACREWSLNTLGCSANAYQLAGGVVVSEGCISNNTLSPEFHGSTFRQYLLPLWGKVLFQVNEHPKGYAWGQKFVRTATPPFHRVTDIVPWEWTYDNVAIIADGVDVLDNWNNKMDCRMTFTNQEETLIYMASFDWYLLQTWERI